ncbi:MAG: ornithine cyclodeaminase family protein [Burkholderiaceae bacterium]
MKAPSPIPHLSEDLLISLNIDTQDIIAMMETVIRGGEAGTVWSAPKSFMTPPDGRYVMATLAAIDEPPLVVTKSLVLNERNLEQGLPQINGLVSLLHGQTGLPVATVDNNWVTAVRTAGLSAVAAKYMANENAASIGFIGAGVQAQSHLDAFKAMFPLERVKIFGRGQKNIDRLAASATNAGLKVQVCETAQQALEEVALAVTSVTHTGVSGPFLRANWLSPGAFVSAVDLGVPWHKESFSVLDKLAVDDLKQEAALPNKLADPAHVHGDLADLVHGRVKGRANAQDRTAFVFRGHALGDLALAVLAYQRFSGHA